MSIKFSLSDLGHTWILDLDGTIVKHNGYKTAGVDTFLPGAKKFLSDIPSKDMIIFITARESKYRQITEDFLKANKIRYDYIIFDAPSGERILLNDKKPSGLNTSYSANLERDREFCIEFEENPNL